MTVVYKHSMRRSKPNAAKTERINLCLTESEREALEQIAEREDRELGYLASWFVQWGIRQYVSAGASLVALRQLKVARLKEIQKQSAERLVLREEAQRENEAVSDRAGEKKRA
jgi:hypothetical protein